MHRRDAERGLEERQDGRTSRPLEKENVSVAQVSASSSATIAATPDRVLAALADYETVRPRILPEQYRDYEVVQGGQGDGTVATWTLQATEKRVRNVAATVTVAGSTITERDANSSMVTTWSVAPDGAGTTVTTTTEWKGAGGIGGFFEKTFAPLGLKKIQAATLDNLRRELI
jgi:carbon monoxide dehydrogenase subunit G